MTFAIEISDSFDAKGFARFEELARTAVWGKRPFPAYWDADVSEHFPEFVRAFFVCLAPGCEIHRHRDAGDVETTHIVISTNDRAMNFWADEQGEHSQHMEQGKTYVVDRTLEHWARNDGDTNRVHLLLEYRG